MLLVYTKMYIWLFFFLLGYTHASRLTYRPMIIDTYETDQNLEDMKNPYFNSTPAASHLIYMAENEQPLSVYNLNLNKVDEINEISVECYDSERCDTDINELERKYLTLYASMIEECGRSRVADTYSIGLIRDLSHENLMGRFSKTWNTVTGKTLHMTFWIRLTTGYGTNRRYIYSDLTGYPLTVALLEMSVHERAHYDVTNYDPTAGHCDGYQAWYNSLIHTSVRDLEKFNDLTTFVMNDETKGINLVSLFWIMGGVLLAVGILICIGNRMNKPKVRNDLGEPLLKNKV